MAAYDASSRPRKRPLDLESPAGSRVLNRTLAVMTENSKDAARAICLPYNTSLRRVDSGISTAVAVLVRPM